MGVAPPADADAAATASASASAACRRPGRGIVNAILFLLWTYCTEQEGGLMGLVMMMEIPNGYWGEKHGREAEGGFEATWPPCSAPGSVSHRGDVDVEGYYLVHGASLDSAVYALAKLQTSDSDPNRVAQPTLDVAVRIAWGGPRGANFVSSLQLDMPGTDPVWRSAVQARASRAAWITVHFPGNDAKRSFGDATGPEGGSARLSRPTNTLERTDPIRALSPSEQHLMIARLPPATGPLHLTCPLTSPECVAGRSPSREAVDELLHAGTGHARASE
ncbi:uncharacterized protein BP5553_05383 [Venustampulla echinocandica]|uniref:Uncharacterized protein n=1 Tax=Venustampulla echinocandica TaxID=2656787 RepID=A0A370TQZ6_9HELO|nr:uncharacterized protein BP5553_05383 [Venustampulla echinocandica]RDL37950.1 hypothetical protein BP5553_05383 [Venustampulla echinocandica]